MSFRERALQIILLLGLLVFVVYLTEPSLFESHSVEGEAPETAEVVPTIEDRQAAAGLLRDAVLRKDIVGTWTHRIEDKNLSEIDGARTQSFVTMTSITQFRTDGTFEDRRDVLVSRDDMESLVLEYRGWGEWRIESDILYATRTAEQIDAADAATQAWLSESPFEPPPAVNYRLENELEWGQVESIEDRFMVLRGDLDIPLPTDDTGRRVANVNDIFASDLMTYERQ